MSETAELLAQLRDIHEPPAPEATPPTLLLGNLVALLLILAAIVWRYRRRRRAWLTEALQSLDRARREPVEKALHGMAVTLRRVVKLHDGDGIETLQGDAWLHRLDHCFDTDWFTHGRGRVFGDALYAEPATTRERVTVPELHRSLTRLLRQLARR